MSKGPRQIKPKRLAELRKTVAQGNSGFVSFASIRALLDDRDWHRRRVPVDTDDIRRSGVGWEHMQAWVEKTGPIRGHDFSTPDWAHDDAAEGGWRMRRHIQATIRLAVALGRGDSELDLLAAMRDSLPKAKP